MIIKSINGTIPFTEKNISIDLDDKKSVVIIGNNGSGKTSLLQEINKYFESIFSNNTGNFIEEIKRDIDNYTRWMNEAESKNDYTSYYRYKKNIDQANLKLKEFQFKINVVIDNIDEMVKESYYKKFIYFYFRASRQISINESHGAKPISEIKESWLSIDQSSMLNRYANQDLESYLITLYTQEALYNKNNEPVKANKLSLWISELEEKISILMECRVNFEFDYENYKLYIVRDQYYRSSFRELSSGYSAILDIFTEILFRASLYSIEPSEIKGIVLIDEIDAHLHLSIQRKVLPMLISTFPKIQFIITTHSPFVLGSSDDFIIFDITKNINIPSLTMYSYENIVKNILDVDVIPNTAREKIQKLKEQIEAGGKDKDLLNSIFSELESSLSILDSESKAIYYTALNMYIGE